VRAEGSIASIGDSRRTPSHLRRLTTLSRGSRPPVWPARPRCSAFDVETAKKSPANLLESIDARKRYRLCDAHVQMAREIEKLQAAGATVAI